MQLKYYIFDWDDNILHMDTKINLEVKTKDGWILTEITTTAFTKARSNPNYRLPQINGKDNLALAYINFRDTGTFGDNAFLKDCTDAIDNGKIGPSYMAFKNCLIEGRLMGICTARGHNPKSLKKGVHYFIEHELNNNEKKIMKENLSKFHIIFNGGVSERIDLIDDYLNNCDFIGVSSDFFIDSIEDHEIPSGGDFSPTNPELSKQIAIERIVKKCDKFSKILGDKLTSIKIGFSDDDKGNINHIIELFSIKLKKQFSHIKFIIYDTSKNEDGTKNYIKNII